MKTLTENFKLVTTIYAQSCAGSAKNGAFVDCLGYENAALVVEVGDLAAGSDTVLVEVYEDDAGSAITDGTLHAGHDTSGVAEDAHKSVTATYEKKITVINLNLSEFKRYLRAKVTPTDTTILAAHFVLFNGRFLNGLPTQENTALTLID